MAKTINLDFELYDKQKEFVDSTFKYTGFVSGIGAGKTFSGAVKSLIAGVQTKGMGLIVAPTYSMLNDSTLRTLRQVAGNAITSFNRSEKRGTFVGGGEFICRSADNPEHLRGPNISWIWLDEAQLIDREAWLICEGRLREGIRQAWATFTPNGKTHWTYNVFGKDDARHKLVHAETIENIWLPPDYIEALYASYTGSFADQELRGSFVDPEGTLFQRSWFMRIRPSELPLGLNWVRGWDLALTEEDAGDAKKRKKPDRTASVRGAVDPMGNIYIDGGTAFRKEWPMVREEIIRLAVLERNPIVVETVAFQKATVQELLREPRLMGIEVKGYTPGQRDQEPSAITLQPDNFESLSQQIFADRARRDRDVSKLDRARLWQSRAANRQIFLVESEWSYQTNPNRPSLMEDFLDEVCDFRADMSHAADDWVDAVSIVMKHLKMPTLFEPLNSVPKPTGLIGSKAFDSSGQQNSSNIIFI